MTPHQQFELRERFDEAWEEIHRIIPTMPKPKVFEIVERISHFDPVTPRPGQKEAEQLRRVWLHTHELAASIRGLQGQFPAAARRHGAEAFFDLLVRFRDAIPTGPLPHTGNKPELHINMDRKKLAAMLAYYSLRSDGINTIEITKKKDGPYFTLSKAFFEIATGNDFGNLDKVCSEVLDSRRERLERLYAKSGRPGRVVWPRTPRTPRQR